MVPEAVSARLEHERRFEYAWGSFWPNPCLPSVSGDSRIGAPACTPCLYSERVHFSQSSVLAGRALSWRGCRSCGLLAACRLSVSRGQGISAAQTIPSSLIAHDPMHTPIRHATALSVVSAVVRWSEVGSTTGTRQPPPSRQPAPVCSIPDTETRYIEYKDTRGRSSGRRCEPVHTLVPDVVVHDVVVPDVVVPDVGVQDVVVQERRSQSARTAGTAHREGRMPGQARRCCRRRGPPAPD